jgi:PKD repeat protein
MLRFKVECKMKNVHSSPSAVFLIFLAALANLTFALHVQQTSTRVYLDPGSIVFYTNQTSVGHPFNVTVWVENAPDMAAWELSLGFNDSVLYVTRWFEPKNDPLYIFYGKTTFAVPSPPIPSYDHIAPGNGSILVAATLFPLPPTQQPSSGSGKLCILEFNITMLPPKDDVHSSMLNIDNTGTYLLDPDGYEIQSIVKEDGLYDFIYNTPPPPYVALDQIFMRFNPYQDISGKTFNMTVLVKDASPNMSITTVALCLTYNQTIVATEQSNVSLSDLWSGSNSITVADGMVNITVKNPTRTPNGTELIGTIRFTVLQQGQSPPQPLGSYVSSDLNFVYTRFQGSSGEITPASPQNGTVRIYAYHPMATPLSTDPLAFNLTTYVGQRFSINVTVSEIFDLHSIQTKILYDPNLIRVLGVDMGSIFRDLNLTQVLLSWQNNDTLGYFISNATVESNVPTPLPVASGSVFQIDFEGNASGTTSLNFSKPYGTDTLLVDSLGNTIPITYYETPLQAEFSYSPIKPTVQDSVSFVDKSSDLSGYVTSWLWNFGDGTTSISQNPVHKFAGKGNHTVTLTVTDNNTAVSGVFYVVFVRNLSPVAGFNFTPASPVVNEDIQFTDTSADPENLTLSSWFWDFGDGTNSTLQKPTHNFTSKGNYTVTLIVADDQNAIDSFSMTISITEPPAPELPVLVIVLIAAVIVAIIVFAIVILKRHKKAT